MHRTFLSRGKVYIDETGTYSLCERSGENFNASADSSRRSCDLHLGNIYTQALGPDRRVRGPYVLEDFAAERQHRSLPIPIGILAGTGFLYRVIG